MKLTEAEVKVLVDRKIERRLHKQRVLKRIDRDIVAAYNDGSVTVLRHLVEYYRFTESEHD